MAKKLKPKPEHRAKHETYPFREFRFSGPIDNPEQWVVEAVRLYSISYNMMDVFSEQEGENLRTRFGELYKQTPEQYKAGFHVLATGAAYLGEDIMMVDGRLTHPIHIYCPACRKASIVNRAKALFPEVSHPLWCLTCDKMAKREDCTLSPDVLR